MTFPIKDIILKKYPEGDITQLFGVNGHLYEKFGMSGHNGIDIYKPKGTPILAPEDGKIQKVRSENFGWGKHIKMTTPTLNEWTFGHCDEIFVSEGQTVKEEEVIGTVGNTGYVISGGSAYWGGAPGNKGVHLHLGLRRLGDWYLGCFGIFYPTGNKYEMLDYDNGMKGAVDPLPEFSDEIVDATINNLQRQVTLLQKVVKLYKKLLAMYNK